MDRVFFISSESSNTEKQNGDREREGSVHRVDCKDLMNY